MSRGLSTAKLRQQAVDALQTSMAQASAAGDYKTATRIAIKLATIAHHLDRQRTALHLARASMTARVIDQRVERPDDPLGLGRSAHSITIE